MSWKIDLANGKDILHTISKKTIAAGSVAHVSPEGVLTAEPSGYRFFPAGELASSEPRRLLLLDKPEAPSWPETETEWAVKHIYFFGLDKLEPQMRTHSQAAGWTAENIACTAGDRLELLVDAVTPEGSSIECSILESGLETPILPQGKAEIVQEIIFPGLPLRFVPDENKPVKLFCNGVATPLTVGDVATKRDCAVYTANYAPKNGGQYETQGALVGIKIVLRRPPHAAGSPVVNSVLLRKWRGA